MGVYLWVDEPLPDYLCFTAEEASSRITLFEDWTPTAVSLEISTDLTTWSDYTLWNIITLSNIWDKVYMRNKSETVTWFSTSTSNYYQFAMNTGSISASWDINYLLCKNSTDTIPWNYCFYSLFSWCTSLTTTPSLPATTVKVGCYRKMFYWCTNLETLPALPTTSLAGYCYYAMFQACSKIKVNDTQTWEYQNAYRIPTTWTWVDATSSMDAMFDSTWWYIQTPSINTTYYTSNTVV